MLWHSSVANCNGSRTTTCRNSHHKPKRVERPHGKCAISTCEKLLYHPPAFAGVLVPKLLPTLAIGSSIRRRHASDVGGARASSTHCYNTFQHRVASGSLSDEDRLPSLNYHTGKAMHNKTMHLPVTTRASASSNSTATPAMGTTVAPASGPPCTACGTPGCSPWTPGSTCRFCGQERLTHPDAGWGDTVPHIMQTQWSMRGDNIIISGTPFFKGRATGVNNSCLIDTLRQALDLTANVEWVRAHLQRRILCGDAQVTSSNFLTLKHHWEAVTDLLFQADVSGKPKLRSSVFQVVRVDLTWQENAAVVGIGLRKVHIARENGCHFVPLFRQRAQPRTAARPQRSDASTISSSDVESAE